MKPLSANKLEIDDPDLSLERLFEVWPETAAVFVELGFLCVGCPVSSFHTILDTCREYGLDEDEFRENLHRIIKGCRGSAPSH